MTSELHNWGLAGSEWAFAPYLRDRHEADKVNRLSRNLFQSINPQSSVARQEVLPHLALQVTFEPEENFPLTWRGRGDIGCGGHGM
jgi:hypothetical protein